jgi:signal transduction histidine kinase
MTSDNGSTVSYHGRILDGDFSVDLKAKLKKAIGIFQAFDQTGSPAIPYISAWQGNEKNIWYEFVSRKFLALLNCGPANIADILRASVVDRRIYKSHFADPLEAKEVTSREALEEGRETFREESEKTGVIQAVYKLKLSSEKTIWLKDQATIAPFPQDDTSLSFGCLTVVTTEMEVEEERQRLISEKNQLESQLQKIHHLEAIGNLAQEIAHDLNQKIIGIEKSIAATIQNLGSDYHGDISAFQDYQNLKSAEQEIKEIKNISNQLLAFAGKGAYNYYETDLNEIASYTLQEFHIMIPDIELTTRFENDIWTVKSDRAMIGRALLNIYRHASQLGETPPTTNLIIETKNLDLDDQFVGAFGRKPGNYVRIRIANPNATMQEEEADRFLEPFQTADHGLQMASAFGIIKKHEGIMSMGSDNALGTFIDVYLPAEAT